VKDPVRLTIEDLAFGGEGVARHEGRVIFVPWVIPGEVVEAEIIEEKKRFARARLRRVIEPSPDRVEPRCAYYGVCGGCQYQHLAYAAQLRVKQKQIADLFERVGGFSQAAVASIEPCPQPYGYRNRLMLRSQWNQPSDRLDIGFLRLDSRLLVDIEQCAIAEPALNAQIEQLRSAPPVRGGLKTVLRVAAEGWDVPRDSFFQTNFFLLPRLLEAARTELRATGARFLIDAYCGVGFFGIELAALVQQVVGVEIDRLAVRAARRNAAQREVQNVEWIWGRTEEHLGALLERFAPAQTALLLDPPRTGCPAPALEQLRASGVAHVLYVSCHPATLARDLKLLCADGVFELVRVRPFDMFPQTQHAECIAVVRRSPPQSRSQ
jgi:tRNA/tmRNA/rRNA uracil-C5-methylase (TrmA/RlmC/RlmD family)